MNKNVMFVTGNNGKVTTLQRYLDAAGLDTTVEAVSLDIVEIQADTALEIAREKAIEAFHRLQRPLVVDDSEFRIVALNGFPGPYQKFMVRMLGPEGVVRLMNGYEDRRAYFVNNLVFVDAEGTLHEFSGDPFNGTIVEEYDASVPEYAWGLLGKIFIMEGSDKVQSLLTPDELIAVEKKSEAVDAYEKFSAWYKERHA